MRCCALALRRSETKHLGTSLLLLNSLFEARLSTPLASTSAIPCCNARRCLDRDTFLLQPSTPESRFAHGELHTSRSTPTARYHCGKRFNRAPDLA